MAMTDPYTPTARTGPPPLPAGSLPEARLARLGVGPHVLTWLRAQWDAADLEARADAARDLASTGDLEVAAWLVDGMPPDGTVDQVLAWVDVQPDRAEAAQLARAVESAQPSPRVTLLARLDTPT